MSAQGVPDQVDVLEFLAIEARRFNPEHAEAARQCRATVAELIEADKEYDEARKYLGAGEPATCYARLLAAITRRDAALARAGGAK